MPCGLIVLVIVAIFYTIRDLKDEHPFAFLTPVLKLTMAIWTVAYVSIVLTLIALTLFFRYGNPGETLTDIAKEDNHTLSTSNCWKQFVCSWPITLSATVDRFDIPAIFDQYASTNLICVKKKNRTHKEMMNKLAAAKYEFQQRAIFEITHFNLLVDYLSETEQECYVEFCKISLRHPKYQKTRLKLCKSCETCCVDGLDGNWSHVSKDSCSVSTELASPVDSSSSQTKENKVVFHIRENECSKWFSEKEYEYRSNFELSVVHVIDTEDDCNVTKRRCLAAYNNASLVCSDEVAILHVNVEPEVVDKEKLKASLAKLTNVSSTQIRLEIIPKDSTLILLLLPPRAGMELLSIVINAEKRHVS